MNGKQAKRLRKIAAELAVPAKTTYDWAGLLQREPVRTIRDHRGITREVPGRPIRRHIELGECQRRAVQEAKKLYKCAT